jgi:hypothetical protein
MFDVPPEVFQYVRYALFDGRKKERERVRDWATEQSTGPLR